MNILRTLWKSLKDLFEDLFILALVNILWILINAPLAVVGFFALSNSTYGASLTVVDKRWERVVTIEQLRVVTGDGWLRHSARRGRG